MSQTSEVSHQKSEPYTTNDLRNLKLNEALYHIEAAQECLSAACRALCSLNDIKDAGIATGKLHKVVKAHWHVVEKLRIGQAGMPGLYEHVYQAQRRARRVVEQTPAEETETPSQENV